MPNLSDSYQRSSLIEYNPYLIHEHSTVIMVEHSADLTSYIIHYRARHPLQRWLIEVCVGLEEEAVVWTGLELQQRGPPYFHITIAVCIDSTSFPLL